MNDISEKLKGANTTVVITPEPLIMEKVGEAFRGVYLGIRPFDKFNQATGEIERKPVAHFYDGERVLFNMGAQLTRALEALPVGISVELTLRELSPNKNKDGKTKIYSVAPLDLPRFDLAQMFGGVLELTAPKEEHLKLPAPAIESELEAHEAQPPFVNYAAAAAYVDDQLGEGASKAFAAWLRSGGLEKFNAGRDSHLAYEYVHDELTARVSMADEQEDSR